MIERYPLGTEVRAATSLAPDAPVITGIVRGYVLAKDRATGEMLGGDAILHTDHGTVSVPVAAIRSRVSPPPSRWERRVFWLGLVVMLALTIWALVHINHVARAATLWTWGTYLPIATDACPSVPSVGFCPASVPSQPTPTITPTPEPIVGPPGCDL